MTTLASGKCPHCRSGGDAVAVHVHEKRFRFGWEIAMSRCCACGEEFINDAPADTRGPKPITLEQRGEG